MKLNAVTYHSRIDEIIEKVNAGELPAQMGVLADGLRNTIPAMKAGPSEENRTSVDIRNIFSDACSLTLNEVAEVMIALGYKVWFDPFDGPQWCVDDGYEPDGGDGTVEDARFDNQ